ncbi:MAG TPA: hypothetical protein PKD85_20350, partial [Saprospiraceae bacterium]|nr:hypothetical protein [Saprospiraceae bacterium]
KADFTGPLNSCDGLTISFENTSLATERFEWSFNYPSTDSTFISTEVNPTFTFPSEGIYEVRLLAIRGTDNCRDEVIKKVSVFDLDYQAKFSITPTECKIGDSVRILLTDISTIDRNEFVTQQRIWTIKQDNSTRMFFGQSPEIYVNTNEGLTISLEVIANNGCAASVTRVIEPLEVMLVADFNLTSLSCPDINNITLSFEDISTYYLTQDSISSRRWEISYHDITIIRTEKSFSIDLPRKDISVKLIVTGGPCIDSITKVYLIEELFPTVDIDFTVSCQDLDARIKFWPKVENGVIYTVDTYYWVVEGQRIDADTLQLTRSFDQSVEVHLFAVLSNGCEIEVSKIVNLNDFQKIADFSVLPVECPDDETVNYQILFTGSEGYSSLTWKVTVNDIVTTFSSNEFIFNVKKNSIFNVEVIAEYSGECTRAKTERIVVSNFAELELVSSEIIACPF